MSNGLARTVPMSHEDRIAVLVAMFLQGRRTENTRLMYAKHLQTWLEWSTANHVDVFDARHAHVALWLAAREQAGDSDSTRAARLSAVSSWYRWLQREDLVSRNPTALLPEERPKPNPAHTPALSSKQAEDLLVAADADGARSSALIALMLYTGARIGELLSADVSSIGQESGVPVLRIIGKGRKRRNLPIIPAVYVRLERYLASRPHGTDRLPVPSGQAGSSRSQPLFTTSTGGRLMPTQVRKTLLKCATQARLDPEVIAVLRPHSTRATYATSNLAAGTPLRDVQYALGHEDPRTTEGYDRSSLQLDRHPSTRLATVIKPPVLGPE